MQQTKNDEIPINKILLTIYYQYIVYLSAFNGGSVMFWEGLSNPGITNVVQIHGELNGQWYIDEVHLHALNPLPLSRTWEMDAVMRAHITPWC